MVVLPVLVSAGYHDVLSLEPEFVLCEDGADKQDCESAAAKRWLKHKLPEYKLGKVVTLGDALYCRQPVCETVLATGHDFVFVCKPSSHKTLYEYLALSSVEEVTLPQGQGKKQRTLYRFVNNLPLRDGPDALEVNWCEITEQDANGKTRLPQHLRHQPPPQRPNRRPHHHLGACSLESRERGQQCAQNQGL